MQELSRVYRNLERIIAINRTKTSMFGYSSNSRASEIGNEIRPYAVPIGHDKIYLSVCLYVYTHSVFLSRLHRHSLTNDRESSESYQNAQ